MKISCVFSKMQEFGHFPIISSLIDRLIFYQLVFDSFMFTSLVFICVGFSVIGSSVAAFTVTGFPDDGLANSGSFLKRSEFVFVVLLTPFSAWDMKHTRRIQVVAYKRKNPPFSTFIPTLNPSHQSKAGRDILYPQPSRLID